MKRCLREEGKKKYKPTMFIWSWFNLFATPFIKKRFITFVKQNCLEFQSVKKFSNGVRKFHITKIIFILKRWRQ